MRITTATLLLFLAFTLCGCEAEERNQTAEPVFNEQATTQASEDFSLLGMIRKMQPFGSSETDSESEAESLLQEIAPPPRPTKKKGDSQQALQTKSDNEQAVAQAIQRKIIRDGRLILEVDNPAEEQRRIASIAEAHGGFVVTSEFKQSSKTTTNQRVSLIMRIPAAQFDAAVTAIHAVANRLIIEQITGEDVTEESLDLEARSNAQKALESQFLEIMKQTKTVADALGVQRELAAVRTDIEALEGRRRFLENQSALSTITIVLQTPAAIVAASTSGFGAKFKRAFADGLSAAIVILLFFVRACLALAPIAIVLLPLWRLRKNKQREPSPPKPPEPIEEKSNPE